MDLLAERGRRVSVDELNTSRLLAHARKQAVKRKLDDVLIVDVDAHHYENEHYSDILAPRRQSKAASIATCSSASAGWMR